MFAAVNKVLILCKQVSDRHFYIIGVKISLYKNRTNTLFLYMKDTRLNFPKDEHASVIDN